MASSRRSRAYETLVEAPRSATVKVKSITEAIVATFERADRVLKGVLDSLALQFEATAPAFYADYENARAIVDRPGGAAGETGEGHHGGLTDSPGRKAALLPP